jgi:hypothetical protein
MSWISNASTCVSVVRTPTLKPGPAVRIPVHDLCLTNKMYRTDLAAIEVPVRRFDAQLKLAPALRRVVHPQAGQKHEVRIACAATDPC